VTEEIARALTKRTQFFPRAHTSSSVQRKFRKNIGLDRTCGSGPPCVGAVPEAVFRDHLPDDILICESAVWFWPLGLEWTLNIMLSPSRSAGLKYSTGAERRRTWRNEDKARIVAEIATSGDSVCAVARRHGLSPQQLFGWRRQLKESEAGGSEADGLQFVPAVVDAGSSAVPQRRLPGGKSRPVLERSKSRSTA
jgi:transposase-like protein